MNSVVGHEITHILEGTEFYDTLQQSIVEYAKTKGDYQNRFDTLSKLYEGVEGANIDNELTADLVGDYLFSDTDFVNSLSTEQPNLFKKIYNEIKYLCKVATAGSKEARELEKVKKAFDNAWKESGKAQKNTTDEGGEIKYSLMNDATFEENAENIIKMTDDVALKNKEQGNFIRVMNNTPSVILENVKGAEDYEVIIRFDALYLAAREDGALEGHYHNLGKDIITKLPQFIEKPDAIVRMNDGRLNIFTVVETPKGNNGIVSMEMNTVKDINSKNDKYNLVVSVFSAKDNYTKNNLLKNGVEIEYEKEDLSQVNPQLYEWLATINDKSSKTNIPQNSEKSSEKEQYSLSDSDNKYNEAVKNNDLKTAQMLVKESAEKAGYTDILYHGTKQFGFTEFDASKSDDKISFFVAGSDDIAQTYSGKYGSKAISSTESVDDLSIDDVVNKLREEAKNDYKDMQNEYEIMHTEDVNALIQDVNSEVDKLQDIVKQKIKDYADKLATDFDDKTYKTHKYLVDLVDVLKNYQYYDMPTKIYMLLHHTDAFNEGVIPSEIEELTVNIRLMNRLTNTDIGDGVVVNKQLGGYVLSVLSFDEARTELKNKLSSGNYALFGKPGKQFVVDCKGSNWNDITYYEDLPEGLKSFYPNGLWRRGTTRDVVQYAKSLGYDSVKFENIVDNGGRGKSVGAGDVYAYFNPNDLKSADTITYDSDGNVIPLSERFNEDNKDIRYSLSEDGEQPSDYNKSLRYIRYDDLAPIREDIPKKSYKTLDDTPIRSNIAENTPPTVLFNMREGENGWGNVYSTSDDVLWEAVKYFDQSLWNAVQEEVDSGNVHTPVLNACLDVMDYVRQEEITPMQGARLVSEAYHTRSVDSKADTVLFRSDIEKAKQYTFDNPQNNIAPVVETPVKPVAPTTDIPLDYAPITNEVQEDVAPTKESEELNDKNKIAKVLTEEPKVSKGKSPL